MLAPFFSHLEGLFLLFNCEYDMAKIGDWRADRIGADNPKLQAEIARGVKADKAARAAKKGKKVL